MSSLWHRRCACMYYSSKGAWVVPFVCVILRVCPQNTLREQYSSPGSQIFIKTCMESTDTIIWVCCTCTVHGCLCTGGADGEGAEFSDEVAPVLPELEGWEWLTTVHGELLPLLLLLLPPPVPPLFSFFFFLSLVRVCLAKVALNALPTISLSSLAWTCVCVCVCVCVCACVR